ncbi:MAG: hypothetical protein AAF514_23840, partial [Verrucomicrobiota bacterium]
VRRFAGSGKAEHFRLCARLFQRAPDESARKALLSGFEQAFEGRSLPVLPTELAGALAEAGKGTLGFRVRAGEPAAITEAMELLKNPAGSRNDRLATVRAFGVRAHPPAADGLLEMVLADEEPALRRSAMVALQIYQDASIGSQIAAAYASMPSDLQENAVNLLASRPAWALALLEQVSPLSLDLSRDVIDRLRLHQNDALQALVARHFPVEPKTADEDLARRVAEIRAVLKQVPGDPYKGESIYAARCLSCHQLFHKGGRIGPDLTSYQREDLSTLLPSLIAPSAEIREGYENYLVTTKDGRAIGGFLSDQSADGITLRGFDGSDLSIQRSEIADLKPAGRSLMPAGLLDDLNEEQLRDFFAYLRIPQPISP